MERAFRGANKEYVQAVALLQKTVRAALPIGTRIEVKLGASVFRGLIYRYERSWSHPSEVTMIDEKTGRQIIFAAALKPFRILDRPCYNGGGAARLPYQTGRGWVTVDFCPHCANRRKLANKSLIRPSKRQKR